MRAPLRSFATIVVGALACAPRPARAQAVFKVGTFSKATCTAPCSQGLVAHGLGITPSALIFWTAGTTTTENNGNAPYRWAFGVTDGATVSATGGSRSVSASSQNVVNSSNTTRRAAQKAITIVQYSSALQAEADLGGGGCTISWDATNFCLNWTTNNATAYIIHFIAIGGSGVQAQVVDWTTPAAGSKAVTLAAPTFQPSVVLNFMDYDTTVGAAGSCVSPNCAVGSTFMLGAMDAAGHQWASAFYVTNGANPTTTARAQRTDAAIEETSGTASETLRASWSSMDASGFTVNFTTNTTGSAYHVFSLALTGVNLFVGNFNRSGNTGCPAPCLEAVAGLGFQPTAVLFASFMTTAQAAPTTNAFWGFGATDDTNEFSTTISDLNAAGGSLKTSVNYTEYAHAFDVLSSGINFVALGDIQGATGSFDANGFTMDWTSNGDNVATQITYLALGPLNVSSVTLASFTATRLPDGNVRLDWRTGYEVDNVGFRLYREQNGKRVRITSSIVPGSALMGGGRGMSVGGRTYTWSDGVGAPPDAGPVQYWLEDVDLKGKSTWHGPIVPASVTHSER